MSTLSSVTVKAHLANHFRRFTLEAGDKGCYVLLVKTAKNAFSVPGNADIRVAYLDDEGDWITMSSDDELVDACKLFAGGEGSNVGTLRVRVELVTLPVEASSHSVDSVDQGGDQGKDQETVQTLDQTKEDVVDEPSTNQSSTTSETPQPVYPQPVPHPFFDTFHPDFTSSGNRSPGRSSRTEKSATYADTANMTVSDYVNEFHFYRLIIQTTISQSLRSLFNSPDPNMPNGLDAAVNEFQYRRIVIQTAVASALHNLFSETSGSQSQGASSSTSQASNTPLDSIRATVTPLLSSTATAAEALIDHLHRQSWILAQRIQEAVREQRENEGMKRKRDAVRNAAKTVLRSVGAFLVKVGESMVEDPFTGLEVRRECAADEESIGTGQEETANENVTEGMSADEKPVEESNEPELARNEATPQPTIHEESVETVIEEPRIIEDRILTSPIPFPPSIQSPTTPPSPSDLVPPTTQSPSDSTEVLTMYPLTTDESDDFILIDEHEEMDEEEADEHMRSSTLVYPIL
ncbi:uncharacterized protein SPPG_03081 [Spizellomyces punctatus DAOM BR117]|uniref:PB1 domain-containing protein n=1 Tax=Spizellomyces punctatus (strain DAOM BR117) TaxID=645134 RepID=A0A0L0HIK4_SPIPD|nr:uncharacterized protein SPPG_03081 [Spizellomyces punctatus DAOM BR117]KND01271.1 hypothetical protein SPPG_03081 [Spizellomyces punctatus DAOM BR117]|eukprot:XP_016609310.1 hypothetical protein SPPG_03081 [Spizellomyces punctatus DAOM BR117]